jgi:uncharacterized surface protein with fasciclin (FAS1) repeats
MNRRATKLIAAAGLLGLLAAGCNDAHHASTHHAAAPTRDLVDTAASAGTFDTLVTAVKEAHLVETLRSTGPYTVFAPTDEAFAKLPHGTLDALLADRRKLQKVLLYHVVPGRLDAAEVTSRHGLETAQGARLPVTASHGKVHVGRARITATDIAASNGVIHVIDSVLLPPGM